ncbi:Serine acetyltransferase [Lactobacillus helveticus]|nr:Serine acetyltransferase [Lactobacillus helveticus]
MYDAYLKYRIHRLGVRLGFGIPINAVGPGLRIDHFGFVAINGNAKIGKNCHIYGDITIGQKGPNNSEAPIIRDNVIIGAGARIIGPIKIASNCVIGANAVVIHSVLEEGKTIVGIPARVLNK